MIGLDTNVLVYARRAESPHHTHARLLLTRLAEGDAPWAIPWPCIYEFLRVVTHPRVFAPPTGLDDALDGLESLFDSPTLVLLGEGPTHRAQLRRSVLTGKARGNLVHDAHIAALALEHGVTELWTTDRDFARFPGLRTRDPFDDAVRERGAAYRAGRSEPAPSRRTRPTPRVKASKR